jgi:hypothetical protein
VVRPGRARKLGPAVIAIAALIQAACFGGNDPPARLVDGTAARQPPVALDGTDSPQVETRATAIDLGGDVPAHVARCLVNKLEHTRRAPAVLRVGVDGMSVTFSTASGHRLVACDGTATHDRPNPPWCGRALGRVSGGRLLDPRLDLASCSTASGDSVAFVWVETGERARYVGVDRGSFLEAYPVIGHLPVRIATTSGIDLDSSTASFEISEHDARGHLLRSYPMRARVAG